MLIGHFDCDSFFVSCEKLFDPGLNGKPVVVLSNNDGCVVSRSKEAKAIGIKMGALYFEIKNYFESRGGVAFSSNFSLYADLSSRVMSILSEITNDIEIYSIDEAFLNLSAFPLQDLEELCITTRKRIIKEVGIPVSIGVDTTKTQAKIATDLAKKAPNGVFVMANNHLRESIYKTYPAEDIWGIGSASALKLKLIKVNTAFDMIKAEDKLIQKILTITGLRTQHELRGISCIDINHQRPKRKQIVVSRTLKFKVYEKIELAKAVSDHVFRASKKLRDDGLVCYHLNLFILTNTFNDSPQFYGQGHAILHQGESAPNVLIKNALNILDSIFKYGFEYKKCGVILSDLRQKEERQLSLLENNHEENEKISTLIDTVNRKFPQSLKIMSCSPKKEKSQSARMSKNLTTSFDELLTIKI
jgi:DNA polymerase V